MFSFIAKLRAKLRAPDVLKQPIQTERPARELLNCIADVMTADAGQRSPSRLSDLFKAEIRQYRLTEKHAITRITALAGLIRDRECGPCAGDIYSHTILDVLRSESGDSHHASSGSYPQREQMAFRLFYDLHFQSSTPSASLAFADMASSHIHSFAKGEAVKEAVKLTEKMKLEPAYEYLLTHHAVLATTRSPYEAISTLLTHENLSSVTLRPITPYIAVANILSEHADRLHQERTPEWLMDTALWALNRLDNEPMVFFSEGQKSVAKLMAEKWLPAYEKALGVAAVARYAERLYKQVELPEVHQALSNLVTPKLDQLTAEIGSIGPAASLAQMIGADKPEIMAFTAKNLAPLFYQTADEAFKTLAKPLSQETILAFGETLPAQQKKRFNTIRPRSGITAICS